MNKEFTYFVDVIKSHSLGNEEITIEEVCYIWLAERVLGLTFYDDYIACNVGKMLYKTIKAIIERTQATLVESEDYEKYLICLNLIGTDTLNWGTSIRFCWFDDKETEKKYKTIIDFIDKKIKEGGQKCIYQKNN